MDKREDIIEERNKKLLAEERSSSNTTSNLFYKKHVKAINLKTNNSPETAINNIIGAAANKGYDLDQMVLNESYLILSFKYIGGNNG